MEKKTNISLGDSIVIVAEEDFRQLVEVAKDARNGGTLREQRAALDIVPSVSPLVIAVLNQGLFVQIVCEKKIDQNSLMKNKCFNFH